MQAPRGVSIIKSTPGNLDGNGTQTHLMVLTDKVRQVGHFHMKKTLFVFVLLYRPSQRKEVMLVSSASEDGNNVSLNVYICLFASSFTVSFRVSRVIKEYSGTVTK